MILQYAQFLFLLLDTSESPYPLWAVFVAMGAAIGIIFLSSYFLKKNDSDK